MTRDRGVAVEVRTRAGGYRGVVQLPAGVSLSDYIGDERRRNSLLPIRNADGAEILIGFGGIDSIRPIGA